MASHKSKVQLHTKPTQPKPPRSFFQRYFWLLVVLGLALFFLLYADQNYIHGLGLGVQQGLLADKTAQSAVLWTADLFLTFKLYGITIRAKDKFKGGYRFFYYFSFLNWPAAILLVLVLVFQTPQQTIDLFHYWSKGTLAEHTTQITDSYKSCGTRTSSSCTLIVTTSDQGTFHVNGYMNSLILAHESEVTALRYLPSSRKIVNFPTAEGWQ
ncbi:hypothetical protein [Paenibacillus sp. IHBB 3054]|uniref:hypothetical protein n=1 Tax=Paenibacillus sp. IHBB 3054 TaxID=3425689 RepID=UPI003F66FFC6